MDAHLAAVQSGAVVDEQLRVVAGSELRRARGTNLLLWLVALVFVLAPTHIWSLVDVSGQGD